MAPISLVRKQHAAVMLAVLVILSLGATVALAGAPASRLFQSPPPVPLANDNFADATLIDTFPFHTSVDTQAATTEGGEPMNWNCGSMDWTVWYKLEPTAGGVYEVNTQGGTMYETSVSIWQGTALGSLSPVVCGTYNPYLTFAAQAGATYYIQLGTPWFPWGSLALNVSTVPPPLNDDFANAAVITGLPYQDTRDIHGATTEPNEPTPSCAWSPPSRSIWYSYTAAAGGSLTASASGGVTVALAVYSGDSFASLTQLACQPPYGSPAVFDAQAGVTYRFQVTNVYSHEYGTVQFNLDVTPPPVAGFSWWSNDPSKYDTVQFCDQSYDPVYKAFSQFWWDFGDGATATDYCANHQFVADGDYTVWHKVQTTDGRTGDVTRQVAVRTHDVAITKFTVPQSASAGQTRQIVVGLRNYNYPEEVQVELQKSVVGGYTSLGWLRQQVPVRSGNRTTDFNFSYTFTNDDAKVGKVTFTAVATVQSGRDALPADNEAVSPPTKVAGK